MLEGQRNSLKPTQALKSNEKWKKQTSRQTGQLF